MKKHMEAIFHAVRPGVAVMLSTRIPDGHETAVINVHVFVIKVTVTS